MNYVSELPQSVVRRFSWTAADHRRALPPSVADVAALAEFRLGGALVEAVLVAFASDVVVEDGQVVGRAELGARQGDNSVNVVAKLSAHNLRVVAVPLEATDSAPLAILHDFHAAHVVQC